MDHIKFFAKGDNELKSIVNAVKCFSDDIAVDFGFDKCLKVT